MPFSGNSRQHKYRTLTKYENVNIDTKIKNRIITRYYFVPIKTSWYLISSWIHRTERHFRLSLSGRGGSRTAVRNLDEFYIQTTSCLHWRVSRSFHKLRKLNYWDLWYLTFHRLFNLSDGASYTAIIQSFTKWFHMRPYLNWFRWHLSRKPPPRPHPPGY